ncbi:MAG: helix-turn-helix domain-containing protein [Clostridium sp.]
MWNLGERIKKIRKEKKITQEYLSGEELNRTVLSKIENNLQEPSISQLYYICKKLDISVCSLFHDENYIMEYIDTQENYINSLYNKMDYSNIIKFYDLNKKDFSSIKDKIKYFYLGMSYYSLNMFNLSTKHLNKFISYYLKNEDIQEKRILEFCEGLNALYKIEINFKKNTAISHLNLANIYIAKYNIENSEIAFKILNNICVYYLRKNDYSTVINLCKYFETMNHRICYPTVFFGLYNLLAIAYYNIDNYKKSILCIKKTINILLFMGDEENAGLCHINYINALRYSKNYSEALKIIDFCKDAFKNYETVVNSVTLQEIIVYFNNQEYHKALRISRVINKKKLSENEKIELSFILGIIDYKCGLLENAYKKIVKCEKYFLKFQNNLELKLLYNICFKIKGDEIFLEKLHSLNLSKLRKNILV